VLVGLGVDELSLAPSRIPSVKAGIRAVDKGELEKVAERALELGSAGQVRVLFADATANR
jgi:phosphoenolpyruvate-protein kinase (PTS system EI component)